MSSDDNLTWSVVLPACPLEGDCLDLFQKFLQEAAPKWSSQMKISDYEGGYKQVDLSRPDGLWLRHVELTSQSSLIPGDPEIEPIELERELPFDRRIYLPFCIFKGADRSLAVYTVGEGVVINGGSDGEYSWSNILTIDVNNRRIERLSRTEWTLKWFPDLCRMLDPIYATAAHEREWHAQNYDEDPDQPLPVFTNGVEALPGLYWMNYFGPPYVEFIGRERLLSAPAFDTRELGEGVLLRLHDQPEDHQTPEGKHRRAAVIEHLGADYFFDIEQPDRETKAPPFLVESRTLFPPGGPDAEAARRRREEDQARWADVGPYYVRTSDKPAAWFWVVDPPNKTEESIHRRIIFACELEPLGGEEITTHVDSYEATALEGDTPVCRCFLSLRRKPRTVHWKWIYEKFPVIAANLEADYAMACSPEEYESRNVVKHNGVLQEVGYDFLDQLPGVYWLNYFSAGFCSANSSWMRPLFDLRIYETREINGGLLIRLYEKPNDWSTEEAERNRIILLKALGRVRVFDRGALR